MAKKKKRIRHRTTPIFSIKNLEIPYCLLGNIRLLKREARINLEDVAGAGFEGQDQTTTNLMIKRLKEMGDYLYPRKAVLKAPFRDINFYVRRVGDIYSAILQVGVALEDIFDKIKKQLNGNVDFRKLRHTVEYDGTNGCIYDKEGIAYAIAPGDNEWTTQIMMGTGGAYSRTFPEYEIDSPDAGEKSFEKEVREFEQIGNMIMSGCYKGYKMVPFKKPVNLVPV